MELIHRPRRLRRTESIRSLVREILEDEGYDVSIAEGGEQARL